MKLTPLIVTTGFGLSLLQGCAPAEEESAGGDSAAMSTRGLRFTNETINVDQTFANTARVEADRIVVPKEPNHEILSRIRQGAILAGNRDTRTTDLSQSANPYGFLRRVKEMAPDGANMIIVTEQAELSDWLDDGDIDFRDVNASPFKAGPDLRNLALQPLDNGDNAPGQGAATAPLDSVQEGPEIDSLDKKFRFKPIVKFANASFKLNAQHDGYFRVKKVIGLPKSVDYRSHLVVDPVVSADITAGVSIGRELASSESILGEIPGWEQTWRMNTAPIPIGGPIPITARFTPEVFCKISAGGALTATVHAEVKAHGTVGFEGRASWNSFDWKDLSEAPSFQPSFKFLGVQGKASMVAECAIYAVASVMLFDAAGVEGKVGPRVSLNANACAAYDAQKNVVGTDFNLFEQHGLVVQFGGRVQLPVLGVGKSFNFKAIDLTNSQPTYFVGDAKMCPLSNGG